MMGLGLIVVLLTAGCASGTSQREANAVRAATYGAELDACIATNETQEEAQKCWCEVARRWTRSCPSIDGDAGP